VPASCSTIGRALALGALRLFHRRMLAGYAAQALALVGRPAAPERGSNRDRNRDKKADDRNG
jgi:hypothetical protein